jgi:hypothetical protein
METKKCTGCLEVKSLDDFVRQKRTRKDGSIYYVKTSRCKVCHCKVTTEWKQKNKATYNSYKRLWRVKHKDREWARAIKRNYKITEKDYQRMLLEQNNQCAICKCTENIFKGKSIYFCVDHDHGTGQVRGLLCTACNRGLGLFKDNVEVLKSSVEYLTRQKSDVSLAEHTAGDTSKGIACQVG